MFSGVLTTIALLYLPVSGSSDQVDKLIEQLKSKDAEVRASAADGLAKLGKAAKRAVPELAKGLKDEDFATGARCAYALGMLGRDAPEATTVLVEALGDHASFLHAFQALEDMDVAALPALISALKKGVKFRPQATVIGLLGELGDDAKAVVPDLRALLKDKSLRNAAAQALPLIDPDNKDAIPVLQELLGGTNQADRFLAAMSLAKSTRGAKLAVPTLIKGLEDKNIGPFFASLFVLGGIGPEAREALPALSKLLLQFEKKRGEDPGDATLRALVAGAVLLIDRANKEAARHAQDGIPDLVFFTSYRIDVAAEFAVRVLGQLGPTAKEALPALEKCLKHKKKRIQRAAQESIKKITQQ